MARPSAPLLPGPGARAVAVGCGTSYYMAQAYAALREQAGLGETDAFPASEVPLSRGYDHVVVITRSGTTSEVLDLVGRAQASSRVTGVTAVQGTPLSELVAGTIVLGFADEASVVQTRFATSALALLRAHLGEDVTALATAAERALSTALPVDPGRFEQFVFIGRGMGAALASEAALKLRETSAAWTEAYPAMELRHGPMSTLGPRSVVWCLGPPPPGLEDEVRSTGATWVSSPEDPMVGLVLVQRLAVARALSRGLDPDHPRFLSRSVVLPSGTSTVR